ncbi:ComEC/Rec2 family competence protein [Amorphus sp. 3PC139-8]|uniref:ComEC/Rec2 family competence protein n=1 Tax=Amorphus sp. 3PC139-8 TaxID=2735676 RepID=UPI00345CCEE8
MQEPTTTSRLRRRAAHFRALPFRASVRSARLRGLPSRVRNWVAQCLETDLDRGRGFLWLPVAAAVGIAVYFALPREPHWPTLAGLGLAVSLAAVYSQRHRLGFAALATCAAVLFAMAAVAGQTARVQAPVVPYDGTFVVRGFVETREPRPDGAVRYVLRVVSMEGLTRERMPHRVRMTARGRGDRPEVGDGVRAIARLAPPRGPVAPGGYNSARRLFFEGIGASGFSYGLPKPANLGSPPLDLRVVAAVAHVRANIAERLRMALPGRNGELAATLLVGDRGGIPEDTQDAIRAAGLGHILAISGLHMALVAGTIFTLIRFGLAALPSVALTYPIRKWAAAAALLAGFVYLVLSGGAIATLRAFVMLAVALVAILADRPALTLRSVAVAALVVMAIDPAAVIEPGFQMSFAAVIALVAAYEWLAGRERVRDPPANSGRIRRIGRWGGLWIAGLALTSLIAGLATGPIGAFHFHRIAPFGLLGNLLAMPLVTLVVMPAGVVSVALMPLGLDPIPLTAMGWGLDGVVAVAHMVADLSAGAGAVGRTPAVAVLSMAAGLLWLALWTTSWRFLGIGAIAAGLAFLPFASRPDVLIADDGRTVAVRGADGRLRIAVAQGGAFVARMWLEADGDSRAADDPSVKAGILCDGLGCTLPLVRGPPGSEAASSVNTESPHSLGILNGKLAFVERPQAFLEDCQRATILVTRHTAPRDCTGPLLVVDRRKLIETGALALKRIDDPPFYRLTRGRPKVPRPWDARPVVRR